MANIEGWITTKEAATLTGYNIKHIRRLIQEKKIIFQKWGRDYMIDKKSLLEYKEKEGRGPRP